MRRGTMTRLVLLALAAPIVAHSAVYAGKEDKQAAAAPTFSKEFEGKARASFDEAVDSALQKASDEIGAYLREQKPAFMWTPDPAYVRENLLDDMPGPGDDEWTQKPLKGHAILVHTDKLDIEGAQVPTFQVRLRVNVSAQELAHMRQLDQPERKKAHEATVHQRQLWLGKI